MFTFFPLCLLVYYFLILHSYRCCCFLFAVFLDTIKMAASVLFACGLNETQLPHLVHISEESNVDGSFLISSILGQRLRISNAGTLLVCLQHNYHHYFQTGMRLGYNCNIFLDKTLGVIDPLTDMSQKLFDSHWLRGDLDVGRYLLEMLRHKLDDINFSTRINNTIIVDNLEVLIHMGATRDQVLRLGHALAQLTQTTPNLTVITKISNCDLYQMEDDSFIKTSERHVRVVKLKSGLFQEVDGKLLIKSYSRVLPLDTQPIPADGDAGTDRKIIDQPIKEVLYKVNERNIKLFNPGEIGIKC